MSQLMTQPGQQNGNELTKPEKPGSSKPTARLEEMLAKSRAQMEMVLPKHLTVDRLIRVAIVAASRTPKLLQCTPLSVVQSVMTAAQLGLDCGGVGGQGYLVPYFNGKAKRTECQFIPGYRGLIDLARRSGQVTSIEARLVYKGDFFEWECGLNPILKHKPKLEAPRGKENTTLGYAVAHFKDGATHHEVMTLNEIEAIRKKSKMGESGLWVDHWEEMAKKTLIRRLVKYLPMSIEQLNTAVDFDERVDRGTTASIVDGFVITGDDPDGGDYGADDDAPPVDRADALAGRLSAGGTVDPVNQPVEIPPKPTSEAEANRIIEERAAQTRAAEAAKAQAAHEGSQEPARGHAGESQIDPRDEYGEWLLSMHELAATVGMEGADLDSRLKRGVFLKKGLVGKEWELPKSERVALAEVLKERRGIFA
jgi:recombination protein RecT